MGKSWRHLGIRIGLIILGSGIGLALGKLRNSERQIVANQSSSNPSIFPVVLLQLTGTLEQSPLVRKNSKFIAQLVQKSGNAVVRIDTITPGEESLKDTEGLESGIGSGIIMSSNGQIITNAHVVKGATQVKVTLRTGQVYTGQILGSDSITDIAVVKIEANNLPTVTLGETKTLNPGDWAIAIGNPLGLDNTVTLGIISALSRSSSQIGIPNERVKFIQTDAAINPGNSGGPLLNAQGQVIGINTEFGANARGLGFAIPVETAQKIAEQIIKTGHAEHPSIGG